MRVDVWSDVVCPWCFIGLANLGEALQRFEHEDDVDVVLHSFQLDPGAPARDEQPLVERLAQKYGTTVGQIRAQQARIVSLGAERGKEYFQQIGKKGGNATKAKYGPDHFSDIGRKGGESLKEDRGVEFFSCIGQMGGSKVRKAR